jgi:hypothetical protein
MPREPSDIADERALTVRAFYAQLCILSHGLLEPISACAAFSTVPVGNQIADYERLTVFLFRLAAAPRSSKSVAARMVNRWSFQKLGLMPAVYIRVLRRVGRMEVVDQLVKPRGQDDDES